VAASSPLPLSLTVVLVGLIALSAVAIDITLVALPATAGAVGGNPARSGLIITAYLAGFAPGHLLWGMLGDRIGRRPCVLIGLASFIAATAACALATSFQGLLAARIAQGLTGSVGPVVARAIVRDVATDLAGARLLALLTVALGAAPLLAPLAGAALLTQIDWRSIFWVTAGFGGSVLVLAFVRLPETRRPALHAPAPRVFGGRTLALFRSGDFRVGAILVAVPFAGYHTILATYPALAIVEYGIAELHFAWLFAGAAACFSAGSAISRLGVARHGMRRLLLLATLSCVAGAALVALANAAHDLVWLAAGIGLYVLGVGQMLPLATTLALRHSPDAAAWTAAVLGLLQIGGGTLASFAAASSGRPGASLSIILLVCGIAALAAALKHMRYSGSIE
jgi:MFS transporter, DHA1 family, multidrug resistance protein